MKFLKYLLITVFIFSFIEVYSQEAYPISSNFEQWFVEFKPIRQKGISIKQFNCAKNRIKLIRKAIKRLDNKMTSADYLNCYSILTSLAYPKSTIDISFEKLAQSNQACHLLDTYNDRFDFEEKNPAAYQKCMSQCLPDTNQIIFNPQKYALENQLDYSLVSAIYEINKKDVQFKNSEGLLFLENQPSLNIDNQRSIDSVFNVYKTYVGRSLVGEKLEHVMWGVIQYSNLSMMAKYLPVIQQAVKDKELSAISLKMFIDRYFGLMYGFQVYGTQSGFGWALTDEKTKKAISKNYGIE